MSDNDHVVPLKTHLDARKAYALGTDHQFKQAEITLGPWSSYSLLNDPKHLCFVLSRYKFAAKMLEGKESILEVGCGDGIGLPLLAQVTGRIFSVDWDSRLVDGNKRRLSALKNIEHMCVDLNEQDIPLANIDAAVTIDVVEHLDPEKEDEFMRRILKYLHHNSVLVTGTPNIHASRWASPRSRAQHINLFDAERLKRMTEKYCLNVFCFTMNDEQIGTNFPGMAHYLWTIGVGIRGKYLL